ncbi:MAG: hypothetical protein WC273_01435 [Dehalococcoidia bacterium]
MKPTFRISRGAIAAGVAAVLVGLVALAPGTWGVALAQTAGTPSAPPPPPNSTSTVTITVISGSTTTTLVTTPNQLSQVSLPPGSEVTSMTLTTTISPASSDLAAFSTFVVDQSLSQDSVIEVLFDIQFDLLTTARAIGTGATSEALAMDLRGLQNAHVQIFQAKATDTLKKAAAATITVPPETLAQVGGDLSRLQVRYMNTATKVAEDVTMLPSPAANKLSFQFTKEGKYAIYVRPLVPPAGAPQAAPATAPVVPRPANTGTGIPAEGSLGSQLLPIILVTLALGAITGIGLRAARRRS